MAHDRCLILSFRLYVFFVGGLRIGVNKTKSDVFCQNSRLKSSCISSSTVNLIFEAILM